MATKNTHLFFDENGHTIEPPQPWAYEMPFGDKSLVFRHPRVLLDFLRFADSYNEVALPSEFYNVPTLSRKVARKMLSHPSIQDPPAEFADTVWELRQRLTRYIG
jgi:hypothetical protein